MNPMYYSSSAVVFKGAMKEKHCDTSQVNFYIAAIFLKCFSYIFSMLVNMLKTWHIYHDISFIVQAGLYSPNLAYI